MLHHLLHQGGSFQTGCSRFRDASKSNARRFITMKRDQESFTRRFVLCYIPSLVRGWHNSLEPIEYKDSQVPGPDSRYIDTLIERLGFGMIALRSLQRSNFVRFAKVVYHSSL